MKAFATGLLAVAAGVYVATVVVGGEGLLLGYVRAASEAAMVGGLADWFAVTALFRRPLGLPIPHTALIPTKKDALAANLGTFMTEHFLTRDAIRDRLSGAGVIPRLGAWLADPAHAEAVSRRACAAAADAAEAVRPEAAAGALVELASHDAARRSYAPLLGRLLAETVESGTHRPLVDLIVDQSHRWLRANRDVLAHWLKETVEASSVVAWVFTTDKRARRAIDELVRLAAQVAGDPEHELRRTFDKLLLGLADDLRGNDSTAASVDAAIGRFLASEDTRRWVEDVLADALASLRALLRDPDSDLSRNAARWVADVGRRAVEDAAFQDRLGDAVERAALYVVDNYAGEFTSLVETTVAGWDGADAATRIERAVGHDLQFIRVNGTLVGALAGVAIHALALVLD
ncbi:MAG: hypothetical protein QOE45_659 [Frankiaceae bacterium]|nr:hypothetical protein [Frankiaceae bacterium]